MSLAEHVVVGVVGWSNLQTSSTKLYVYVAVFDNRNHSVYQWHDNLLALQPLILWVLRVDTHSGIAHDSLRTSCSHYSIISLFILVDDVALSLQRLLVVEGCKSVNIIFQMI